MSIHEWFLRKKTEKQQKNGASERLNIPENLWLKCPSCKSTIYIKELNENLKVCPKCDFHFRLSASERISLIIDSGTFKEMSITLKSTDFLGFVDSKAYNKRIDEAILKSGLNEAIVIGEGLIENIKTVFGVIDFSFMGGSMGSGVGEKFTRMIEHSIENKIPAIIATSSGGARMQEGILSLMQMAKVSAALARLDTAGGLFISVLTNPTMGGVAASFASLGDVVFAEPKALIGFAGPRTIEATIRIELPKGFQTSEFLLEHGFIDRIVSRKDLKSEIARTIDYCGK